MAGNTYAAPSASRDTTINSKVSAGSGKAMGTGMNKGQNTGGTGQTGSSSGGMSKASIGTGYSKSQNTGSASAKSSCSKTFSSGGVINGKV